MLRVGLGRAVEAFLELRLSGEGRPEEIPYSTIIEEGLEEDLGEGLRALLSLRGGVPSTLLRGKRLSWRRERLRGRESTSEGMAVA